MLHFEGDREFPQTPAEVWAKLRDARFLVRCIPGAENSSADQGQAACTLRPGFAFVRGTLEVTLRVVEAVETSSVRLALHSKGIGSSSDVAAALALTGQDGGTRVHWTADVTSLGGLLKAVPQGLIRGAAEKVIGDVWASVTKCLAAGDKGEGASP
jgi:carbon monoxide dehydrogenase subunit G